MPFQSWCIFLRHTVVCLSMQYPNSCKIVKCWRVKNQTFHHVNLVNCIQHWTDASCVSCSVSFTLNQFNCHCVCRCVWSCLSCWNPSQLNTRLTHLNLTSPSLTYDCHHQHLTPAGYLSLTPVSYHTCLSLSRWSVCLSVSECVISCISTWHHHHWPRCYIVSTLQLSGIIAHPHLSLSDH